MWHNRSLFTPFKHNSKVFTVSNDTLYAHKNLLVKPSEKSLEVTSIVLNCIFPAFQYWNQLLNLLLFSICLVFVININNICILLLAKYQINFIYIKGKQLRDYSTNKSVYYGKVART